MLRGSRLDRRALARRILAMLAGTPLGLRTAAQETRFFRIATGPVGGSAYALGGLLAETVSSPPGTPPCEQGGSCGVPGLVALAQSSTGSLANLDLLAAGRVESALVLADLAEAAHAGRDEPERSALAGRLRALANLLAASVHLLVRPEVPIGGLADLAGRRVGFEEAGSGTLTLVRRLLAGAGLGETDLEPAFLARTPMVQAMAAGALDALILIGVWPLPAVDELVRDWGARLLPVRGPGVDALIREFSYLGYHLIPFGAYPGQPAVETLGVPLLWLVQAELDMELVEAIAGALWHPVSQARLRAGHPQGRELVLEQAVQGLPVPLHPGAERFYRARGVLRDP